jgi:hypothetical protein
MPLRAVRIIEFNKIQFVGGSCFLLKHWCLSTNLFGVTIVPWLKPLFVGLSPRKPGFNPEPVFVGFVVKNVALRGVFL